MKFNIIPITVLFLTNLSTQCCETTKTCTTHTVIVRPAKTFGDLNAISAISHQQYQNTFKPMWEKHYASMTPSHHTVNSFVQEKTEQNYANNKNFIIEQMKNKESNQRLLVAELIHGNQKNIAGYCRFEKKDTQIMYINFIVVAEEFRKRGIAQQLIHETMKTFDEVTECKFRALVHYDFINNLYSKHGCEQTGTLSLDSTTGEISTDPNAPITHIDYSYAIKK